MEDVSRPLDDYERLDPGRHPNQRSIIDLSLLSDGAMTYVYEKVAEELTGLPAKQEITSAATDWGNSWEGEARMMYERVFKCKIEQVGNLTFGKRWSGSPDGLILIDGGIEIKCPYSSAGHVRNMLITNAEDLKAAHKEWYWQIQDLLAGTGRKWWDWLSFHPYFEAEKKMHIVRIYPNEADIRNIKIKTTAASDKVDELLNFIN